MRTGKAPKRVIQPDPIYNSRLVSKLINKIMRNGKKTIAQALVYGALDEIEKTGKKPMAVLEGAISNVSPRMEVRPRRVGGASYQVPTEVRGDRRESLAIRWIIGATRSRSNESLRASSAAQNKKLSSFSKKLAAELLAASEGQGAAIKKKEDTLRMAEANKAFAHFRW